MNCMQLLASGCYLLYSLARAYISAIERLDVPAYIPWMGDWVACTAAQQYRLRVQADVAKIQRHETTMCHRPLPTRFLRSSARYCLNP
jgi:hypothetical protein